MAPSSPNRQSEGTKLHRRFSGSMMAMWCLLAVGALVTWQLVRTANEPLPAPSTVQPYVEATSTPLALNLALAPLTETPENTQVPKSTALPVLTVYYCGNRDNPGEICTPQFGPSPTPAPLLRCDDSRLIGGQDCFWPAPTPESPLDPLWK